MLTEPSAKITPALPNNMPAVILLAISKILTTIATMLTVV
jgi:hypothetical protein